MDLLFEVLSTLSHVTSNLVRQMSVESHQPATTRNARVTVERFGSFSFCSGARVARKSAGILWGRQSWVSAYADCFEGGVRETGPDPGWMWSGSRHISVIGYLNNFYIGGRTLKWG